MEQANGNSCTVVNTEDIISYKSTGNKTVKVKLYDFKRPDKFSWDQIRTIHILHETLARLLSVSISTALRIQTEITVAGVDQMTYEEFICSIPNPSCLMVIQMSPLKGSAVLEIDPCITFSVIDRIFGGNGEIPDFNRDLTSIENKIMQGLYNHALHRCLGESWGAIISMDARLGSLENKPEFAQVVPPTEMVILVSMKAEMAGNTGMINFCIPFLTLEPILHKLTARYWYSSVRKGPGQTARPLAPDLEVDAELYYPTARLSLLQIDQISRGDPVRLDSYQKGTAILEAGGTPVFELTKQDDGFAVISPRTDHFAELINSQNQQEPSPADKIQEQMSSFKEELKSVISRMEVRFQKFIQKQEEMTDQLIMGFREPGLTEAPERKSRQPFTFVHKEDCNDLFLLIQKEYPQLIALVLSYLEPGMASQVLGQFNPEIQVEIIKRITNLDRIAPQVLNEVEIHLEENLRKMISYQELYSTGGIRAAVDILNHATRSVEKNIVEALEQQDPALAEGIKQRMFVFEDVVVLDKRSLAVVLADVNLEELAVAVKVVPADVKEYIYACMEEKDLANLKNREAETGRVKLTDVEAAQQKIVNKIRVMEESGLIVVARIDELVE